MSDNVIVKYSDFFEDDGGFDKVKRDFRALSNDLIKEADKLKDQISIFDPTQVQDIGKIEKAGQELTDTYDALQKAIEDVADVQEELEKNQEATRKSTIKYTKELDALFVQAEQYRVALKAINQSEKEGTITTERAAKARGRLKLEQKALTQEINRQQKVILDGQKLSREEIKLQKAQEVLAKERVESIADIRERLSALRLVQSQINLTTEEGAQKNAEFVAEINQLTERLSENSDKFIQSKINIGNYEESVVNALKQTGLFSTNVGFLDSILDGLVDRLKASVATTKAQDTANKAATRSTLNFAGATRLLGRALKAAGIGVVLTAIASIGAFFNQGRSGAIAFEKTIGRVNAVLNVAINTLGDLASGLISIGSGVIDSFKNAGPAISIFFQNLQLQLLESINTFGVFDDKIAEVRQNIVETQDELTDTGGSEQIAEGFAKIGQAITTVGDRYDDLVATIESNDRFIIRQFEIADDIRDAEVELTKLNKELQLLQIASGDSTISLNEQLAATNQALEKNLDVLEKENDIRALQLELANEKARADLDAARTTLRNQGISTQALDNAANEVEFAKELLALNQQIDLRTQTNPLDDQALQESVDALKAFQEGLGQVDIAEAESAKTRREIQRDLFEQNLDLLIDLIDAEKALNEERVQDTTRVFADRVIEFENFIGKFRQNAQKELDEFTKLAENLGKDIDFDIEFDEEGGFKVFAGDLELAVDDIETLNKQVQDLGLPEQAVNRFREFVVETSRAEKDFIKLNEEIVKTGIALNQITLDLGVDQQELAELDRVNEQIRELAAEGAGVTDQREKDRILKALEELEKEKTQIIADAEKERQLNRLGAIEDEIRTVEAGSDRFIELEREKIAIEKALRDKETEEAVESFNERADKQIAAQEKVRKETNRILNNILDAVVENQQKQVEAAEERVEKQGEAVDEQRRRAEEGLSNTLAFEERERARAEGELIKQQKRLERQEKIRALFTSYQQNASNPDLSGPGEALTRTLSDFAILEAIAASFGEGGVVEDKLPSDGIFRGRSHQGRQGGIPILVEGREGIFSAREMENLGKNNFYAIKRQAGLGPIDQNFFTPQMQDFNNSITVSSDPKLLEEMRAVRTTLQNTPAQQVNMPEVIEGVLQFTETITKHNAKKRNHYRIKKPRF